MSGGAALDLVVVGGGPAGLATAIGARLAGLSVRLFDRRRPPVEKACGEGLMPDAVLALRALGVELAAPAAGRRLRGIRYIDGDIVAEGDLPAPGGLGLRRLDLHRALAARAAAVGVELCWGEGVVGLEADGVILDAGISVAARWVVGADGLHSRVRRWAGLDAPAAGSRRFGVRRHYAGAPWSDLVEVHWGRGCEAYVTPIGPDEIGVAMLWSDSKATFDGLLAHFPALAVRLAGRPHTSRDRGAGPLHQRASSVGRGRVALVGDAAGYLDAITGEGLAIALHQAAALVAALTAGGRRPLAAAAAKNPFGTAATAAKKPFGAATTANQPPVATATAYCRPAAAAHGPARIAAAHQPLRAYAAAHRRIGRLPNAVTRLMLALERHPQLRRRALRALAADPALFSRLLTIHARAAPPRRLGIDGALRLVYRLVTA